MKVRLSTTVNEDTLRKAREVAGGGTDAAMVERALRALIAEQRAVEIDASYDAYVELPPDTPDEWGDPAEFNARAVRAVGERR
ncbi:hypothetical protein ACQBAU_00200 [Propionibacteriaceae bacterium Y2011]|uniref:hypothetical protein n=1 Tax=Microlunatus sp. Y2014 TaxID=3418488 RepID=UPI003B4BDD56